MSGRRLWSTAALLLGAAAVVLAVVVAVAHFPEGLSVLACVALVICAAWYGACRRGTPRTLGLIAAALLALRRGRTGNRRQPAPRGPARARGGSTRAGGGAHGIQGACRLCPESSAPLDPCCSITPCREAGRPNGSRRSSQARRRGIEPIELKQGDDLEELVRDAVKQGADGLAMAGGDGSQAIVAVLASELDLPYACIPSGTRNHLRARPRRRSQRRRRVLDAFVDGGERRVDLAEVNGRVFVNNVSMGIMPTRFSATSTGARNSTRCSTRCPTC